MNDTLPVANVRFFGPDVFELSLHRTGVPFTPGDCVALYAADGRVSRPYSIASGVNDPDLRFVIRHMPAGAVSGFLSTRKPGDLVRLSPPFGWFRPGEHAGKRPFVFIATGTGIAPFLAYLKSGQTPPAHLMYGVRNLRDAYDIEWLKKHSPISLAISKETVEPHHHGRVTDLLPDRFLPDADYYLCGLDAMIDEVTAWLEKRGVDITRIHRECFFNASYTSS